MSKRQIDRMVYQIGAILSDRHKTGSRYIQHRNQGWQPAMNVYRYPDHYEVCLELAGVATEDVRIEVDGRRVVIAGVRHWPDLRCKVTGNRCRRTTLMEIEDGKFWREIEFPEDLDSRLVEITAQRGLVWIRLQLI